MCAAAPTGKLHQDWKDFPKGLHVLVAIGNDEERDQVTGILESCSYRVTAFTSEDDALAALESRTTPFHAAMVDATNREVFDGFKVLEAAKDLAVIMISSTEDIDTMMRAISLGAADFLQKPFSEEKLKNIWQHVARKVMLVNDSHSVPSKAAVKSEPLDEEAQTHQLLGDFGYIMSEAFDCIKFEQQDVVKLEHPEGTFEHGEEVSTFEHLEDAEVREPQADEEGTGDKLQDDFGLEFCTADETCIKLEIDDTLDDLNLGDGIVLDGEGGSDFHLDPSIFVGLPDSDSDSALDINFEVLDSVDTHDSELDGEDPLTLAQVFKSEEQVTCNVSESSESVSITSCSTKDKGEEETKPERSSRGTKSAPGRKKMKVDWTPELHQKFVQAVEQLGVDKAIPSRILEHMGVKCLTRHNVASHLQKYRSHRKHLLQREAEAAANWSHRRHSDSWKNRTPVQTRQPPILPAPPPGGVPLLVWGHPTIDHTSGHLWQQPPIAPPPWHAPDGTLWQHPAACFPPWGHAPAPGTPVYPTCMRVPVAPLIAAPQHPVAPLAPQETITPPPCHPPREVVDAVISEALTNPCTLPLGLKPPSMESVMSELVKQGISITPPTPS